MKEVGRAGFFFPRRNTERLQGIEMVEFKRKYLVIGSEDRRDKCVGVCYRNLWYILLFMALSPLPIKHRPTISSFVLLLLLLVCFWAILNDA